MRLVELHLYDGVAEPQPVRLAVAVQVELERHIWKPGLHLIASRVETRRLFSSGQGQLWARGSQRAPPRLAQLAHQHVGVHGGADEVPAGAQRHKQKFEKAEGLKPSFSLRRLKG
jgi:hypothetical protein